MKTYLAIVAIALGTFETVTAQKADTIEACPNMTLTQSPYQLPKPGDRYFDGQGEKEVASHDICRVYARGIFKGYGHFDDDGKIVTRVYDATRRPRIGIIAALPNETTWQWLIRNHMCRDCGENHSGIAWFNWGIERAPVYENIELAPDEPLIPAYPFVEPIPGDV
jgi:hypothetical protein